MSRETYEVDRLLDLEHPHHERQYLKLGALEALLNDRLTELERAFRAHILAHENEMEMENENVPAA